MDLSTARPTQYTANKRRGVTVITVCDQSHDDLTGSLSRLHWSLPDPVDAGTAAAFEDTYQQLINRMTLFKEES